jgi:hypothetical protein
VSAFFDDHFLAVPGVNLYRRLISHRAGGDKDGRFFFKNFGGAFLQTIYSWVFTVNIVADFSLGHGPTHLGCGFGDGIAAQIDHKFRGTDFKSVICKKPRAQTEVCATESAATLSQNVKALELGKLVKVVSFA